MAEYNLAANLQIQNVVGIRQAVTQVESAFKNARVDVSVNVSGTSLRSLDDLNSRISAIQNNIKGLIATSTTASSALSGIGSGARSNLDALSRSTQGANSSFREIRTGANEVRQQMTGLADNIALAARRFVAFSVGAGAIISAFQGIRSGISTALEFERAMVRLAQVSGETPAAIRAIEQEVTRLSTSLGVSSRELVEQAIVLKQAGLSASETKQALQAIGQASLAPNFGNMKEITEGAISVLRQFDGNVLNLSTHLGAMNEVAGGFAVEASDLVEVTRRAGGAFQQTGGNLNELLGLFTSIRSTTRESADSIATGLRTIFSRLQRSDTVEVLKDFQIQLRHTAEEARNLGDINLEGQFVGGAEAIRRISEGLAGLRTTDSRYTGILEQLGGYRQISRVIPLIQQFGEAQRAVNVAQTGNISLQIAAERAQDSLLVKTQGVKEEYLALFRAITESNGFQALAKTALSVASGFEKVLEFVKPLVPLMVTLAGIKLVQSIPAAYSAVSGRLGYADAPRKFARGGIVTGGRPNEDSVHALLMPGEFVLPKDAAQRAGYGNLQRFADGGRAKLAGGSKISYLDLQKQSGVATTSFDTDDMTVLEKAMSLYQGTGNIGFNQALAAQASGDKETYSRVMKGLDRSGASHGYSGEDLLLALMKHTSKTLPKLSLFRGFPKDVVSGIERQIGSPINSKDSIGKTFLSRGFSSTSLYREEAEKWSKNSGILAQIQAGKHTAGAALADSMEFEVLLHPDTMFEILGKAKNGDLKLKANKPSWLYANGGRASLSGGGLTRLSSKNAMSHDELALQVLGKSTRRDYASLLLAGIRETEANRFVPKGSEFIGNGIAALAFKSPDGDVLRLQPYIGQRPFENDRNSRGVQYSPAAFNYHRPNSDAVLQNTGADLTGNTLIERLPFIPSIQSVLGEEKGHFLANHSPQVAKLLQAKLRASGLYYPDMHTGNVGIARGGPKILDVGSLMGRFEAAKLKLGYSVNPSDKSLVDQVLNDFTTGSRDDGSITENFRKRLRFATGGDSFGHYITSRFLSYDEEDVIRDYTERNSSYEGGLKLDTPEKKLLNNAALSNKFLYDYTLYRGVSPRNHKYQGLLDSAVKGDIITLPGVSSTSKSPIVADGFAGPYAGMFLPPDGYDWDEDKKIAYLRGIKKYGKLLKIFASKGNLGVDFGKLNGLGEVLLPHSSKIKVLENNEGLLTAKLLDYYDEVEVVKDSFEPAKLGKRKRFASGGAAGWVVPGIGNTDSFPADLPVGSFVIRKKSAEQIGHQNLARMASGGEAPRVPALLMPGEFVFGPDSAARIGAAKLHTMNTQARAYALGGRVGFADAGGVEKKVGLEPLSGNFHLTGLPRAENTDLYFEIEQAINRGKYEIANIKNIIVFITEKGKALYREIGDLHSTTSETIQGEAIKTRKVDYDSDKYIKKSGEFYKSNPSFNIIAQEQLNKIKNYEGANGAYYQEIEQHAPQAAETYLNRALVAASVKYDDSKVIPKVSKSGKVEDFEAARERTFKGYVNKAFYNQLLTNYDEIQKKKAKGQILGAEASGSHESDYDIIATRGDNYSNGLGVSGARSKVEEEVLLNEFLKSKPIEKTRKYQQLIANERKSSFKFDSPFALAGEVGAGSVSSTAKNQVDIAAVLTTASTTLSSAQKAIEQTAERVAAHSAKKTVGSLPPEKPPTPPVNFAAGSGDSPDYRFKDGPFSLFSKYGPLKPFSREESKEKSFDEKLALVTGRVQEELRQKFISEVQQDRFDPFARNAIRRPAGVSQRPSVASPFEVDPLDFTQFEASTRALQGRRSADVSTGDQNEYERKTREFQEASRKKQAEYRKLRSAEDGIPSDVEFAQFELAQRQLQKSKLVVPQQDSEAANQRRLNLAREVAERQKVYEQQKFDKDNGAVNINDLIAGRASLLAAKRVEAKGGVNAISETTLNSIKQKAFEDEQIKVRREFIEGERRAAVAQNKELSASEALLVAKERLAKAELGLERVVISETGKFNQGSTPILTSSTTANAVIQSGGSVGGGRLFGGLRDYLSDKYTKVKDKVFGPSEDGGINPLSLGLQLGLPFVQAGIEKLGGEAIVASKAGEKGGFTDGSFGASRGVSGALGGGLLGSVIGSAAGSGITALGFPGIGPYVAPFAAAGGAVIGFVDAMKEAEKSIREIKINENLTIFNDRIQALANLGSASSGQVRLDALSNIQNIQRESEGRTRSQIDGIFFSGDTNAYQTTGDRNRRNDFGGSLSSMVQFLSKEAEELGKNNVGVSLNNLETVLRNGGGGLNQVFLQLISDVRNVSKESVLKDLRKSIEAGQRAESVRNEARQASRTDANLSNLGRASIAIQSAVDDTRVQRSLFSALADGTSSVPINFGAERLANLGRFDTSSNFNNTLSLLANTFGSQGRSAGNIARTANSVARVLPEVLITARGQGAIGETQGDFTTRTRRLLTERLGGAEEVRRNEQLGHAITGVIHGLNQLTSGGLEDLNTALQTDSSALSDNLLSRFTQPIQRIQAALTTFEGQQNQFIAGLQTINQRVERSREFSNRSVTAGIQLTRQNADFNDFNSFASPGSSLRQIPISQLGADFQNRLEQLTSGQTGANARNPALIGRLISNDRREEERLIRAQASTIQQNGNVSQVAEQLNTVRFRIQGYLEALNTLTDATRANAAIVERLNDINQARQGRLNYAGQFATASTERRVEMNRGVDSLIQAFNQGGNFIGFNETQLRGAIETSQAFENVPLPRLGGITGGTARQQFLRNTPGFTPLINGPQGEAAEVAVLQNEARTNAANAQAAYTVLANQTTGDVNRLMGFLREQQTQFFAQLGTQLARADQERLQTRANSVATDRIGINTQVGQAALLRSIGITNNAQYASAQSLRGSFTSFFDSEQAIRDTYQTRALLTQRDEILPDGTVRRRGLGNADFTGVRLGDAASSNTIFSNESIVGNNGFLNRFLNDNQFRNLSQQQRNNIIRRTEELGNLSRDTNQAVERRQVELGDRTLRGVEVLEFIRPYFERAAIEELSGATPGSEFATTLATRNRSMVALRNAGIATENLNPENRVAITAALAAFNGANTDLEGVGTRLRAIEGQFNQISQDLVIVQQRIAGAARPADEAGAGAGAGGPGGNEGPPNPPRWVWGGNGAWRLVGNQRGGLIGRFFGGGVVGNNPIGFSGGMSPDPSIFRPIGTDTVPAMLENGSFVVNRRSSEENKSFLHSLVFGYSSGGQIPAMLTPGEVVVPPNKVRDNLGLLTSLNNGGIARFDDGGLAIFNRPLDMAPLAVAERNRRREMLRRLAEERIRARLPTPENAERDRRADAAAVVEWERLQAERNFGLDAEGRRNLTIQAQSDPFSPAAALLARRRAEERGRDGDQTVLQNLISGQISGLRDRQLEAQTSVSPLARFGLSRADSGTQTSLNLNVLQNKQRLQDQYKNKSFILELARSQREQNNRRQWEALGNGIQNFFGFGRANGGLIQGFANGGVVPGDRIGPEDTNLIRVSGGEYVMPRRAVQNLGVSNFDRIRRFAEGGFVGNGMSANGPIANARGVNGLSANGLATNGLAANGLSPDIMQQLASSMGTFSSASVSLISALASFGSTAQTFARALEAFPSSLNITGSQQINVVFNGAEVFSSIQGDLKEMISEKTKEAIRQVFRDNLPAIGVNLD